MITLYVDMISQPSRACALLCRAARLPVQERLVRIDKQQQRSPEYLAINPFGKVPCLQDGDFLLPESASIARYLAQKFQANAWYPSGLQERARVDSAMDWSFQVLRQGAAKLSWNRVIAKRRGMPASEDAALEALQILRGALKQMEEIWLKHHDFMAGNSISMADLFVTSEIEQLRLLEASDIGPYLDDLLSEYPLVRSYLHRVTQALGPHHSEVYKALHSSALAGRGQRMADKSKL